jgi:uncharacterized protein (TIGR02246 family)
MSIVAALLILAAAPSTEADSVAIKTLVGEFRNAVEKGDLPKLEQTFWPDAVVFEHGGVDRSAAAFVNQHMGSHLKTMKIKWLDEENLGRSEGTMAYVAQRALLETTEKNAAKKAPHTFTFVFRKKDGAWKIAHLHWSIGKAEASGGDAGK